MYLSCMICGYVAKSAMELQEHLVTGHPMRGGSYERVFKAKEDHLTPGSREARD